MYRLLTVTMASIVLLQACGKDSKDKDQPVQLFQIESVQAPNCPEISSLELTSIDIQTPAAHRYVLTAHLDKPFFSEPGRDCTIHGVALMPAQHVLGLDWDRSTRGFEGKAALADDKEVFNVSMIGTTSEHFLGVIMFQARGPLPDQAGDLHMRSRSGSDHFIHEEAPCRQLPVRRVEFTLTMETETLRKSESVYTEPGYLLGTLPGINIGAYTCD